MIDSGSNLPYRPDGEIVTLVEHIRKRTGMYIGKCGDGSCEHDGIYVLFTYAIESVLESMPIGKVIYIDKTDKSISITWRLTECPDSFFPKTEKLPSLDENSDYMISVLAALSSEYILDISTGKFAETRRIVYQRAYVSSDEMIKSGSLADTLSITFTPDELIFGKDFFFRDEFIEERIKKCSTVNPEIKFIYNHIEIFSPYRMKDFIEWKFDDLLLPTIHLTGEGIDVAINAIRSLNSKVKNQYTSYNNSWNGGCSSPETKYFIVSIVKTLNMYYGLSLNIEDYYGDILQRVEERNGEECYHYQHEEKLPGNLVGALWIKIEDTVLISTQRGTLGSKWLDKAETITLESFVSGFIETELPKYLDANYEDAKKLEAILREI